jgi:excinuclease ABC subunit B
MDFKLISEFSPTGDQPDAIAQLVEGIKNDTFAQTLLGVTGSGKTFTIANVIAQTNRPTLVLSHNKTLAAQLYGEFKQFFPNNRVEYFVSYYDYYQPEAYIPVTGTYIEKDLSINDEIEKLRLSATSALLSGRRDVIVVSSVSCIYGIGNPDSFATNIIELKVEEQISRNTLLWRLVESLYSRNDSDFERGTFRVRGDVVDIYLAYADEAIRISFWGDVVESIETFHPLSGETVLSHDSIRIFPANLFVTAKETIHQSIQEIQEDMVAQVAYFKEVGKHLEAKRLEERVNYDLEMIRELGYCSGIENYSRYFDRRKKGQRPFALIDYFPDDFLLVVDESHVTVPQIRAMYGGDRSRKVNLVEYGFRLPAALDNRPLKFEEFESLIHQVIYVSATPADFELEQSEGVIVEQLIRPTGLIDPKIEIRPSLNQMDDLLHEVAVRAEKNERTLVTTLTKRMAEELSAYFDKLGVRVRYIHSDVTTVDRIEILRELRLGSFDVLVGVNLLREGLDLPEVSLVAILDADKEGFLRSERSLTQTAGRAARNIEGTVIMYADKITDSMRRTIDETNRRRSLQMAYNEKEGITPTPLQKSKNSILEQTKVADSSMRINKAYSEPTSVNVAADPIVQFMDSNGLQKQIDLRQKEMEAAAKELDFIEAARIRDEIEGLKKLLDERSKL